MPQLLSPPLRAARPLTRTLVLLFLFCCIIPSCAPIPEHAQLVSVGDNFQLTKQPGSCTEKDALERWQNNSSLSALPADTISIVSWNIYKENKQNWDVDFLYLSKEKDIIFLQEAALTDELQQLLQQKQLYWNLNSAFKYNGTDTGVMIGSDVQPTGSCGLRQNEPLIGLPKTILIQKYKIHNSPDELLVANIHGINITLGTSAYREQMNGMKTILEEHSGPIILAGDFNNWSDKRTQVMMAFAEELSLQILHFSEGGRTLFWGSPVDQIFYRGLIALSHAAIPVTTSDHNPITATFAYTQAPVAANKKQTRTQ